MTRRRYITLHGDRSGWLGEFGPASDCLAEARRLAQEMARERGEAVEARVMKGDSLQYAVRHAPSVTR